MDMDFREMLYTSYIYGDIQLYLCRAAGGSRAALCRPPALSEQQPTLPTQL